MEIPDPQILPILPLRDTVVFPNAFVPIYVRRPLSMAALNQALDDDKRVLLVTQKSPQVETPGPDDLYRVGCVGEIVQALRTPDNSFKALVEGRAVARIVEHFVEDPPMKAYTHDLQFSSRDPGHFEALRRTLLKLFETYAQHHEHTPEDLLHTLRETSSPLSLTWGVAHALSISPEEKQKALEAETIDEKMLLLSEYLTRENELLELENRILTQVRSQINESQREYFLSEQLKIIENELGLDAEEDSELEELLKAIADSGLPDHAREKADREMQRMARMAPMSPEATVARTYIECLLDLPWSNTTEDKLDLERAQSILDEDHFGLEKVKERVVEHLAVLRRVKEIRGPILCLVGPPGVGKTSLAQSVARAMGRQFVRVSLGGMRDEAEIRGHRRTYIGSMPGRILQGMSKAGAANPVFLLDEIDKMGMDFRGDPASALLEVLDPEQNKTFSDHYLEIDFDLSQTMFICTANTMAGIPHALMDRMELIRLPGYTASEKRRIAFDFLIPRQMETHGLTESTVEFQDDAVDALIDVYTREAGVRQLDRDIAALCRKTAKELGEGGERVVVDPDKCRELLGPSRFKSQRVDVEPQVGVALGLAWTEAGGELLPVECAVMPGRGELVLTGSLGDVMRESARAALSIIRANAETFGIDPNVSKRFDIHIHMPEGAIPKDGPSAGVALTVALASALSGRPVSQDAAMTGEVTLRGRVLKIGGLKEKVLAAHRARLKRVIAPEENRDEIGELPEETRDALEFVFAERIETVLDAVLGPAPKKKKSASGAKPRARRRRASRGHWSRRPSMGG